MFNETLLKKISYVINNINEGSQYSKEISFKIKEIEKELYIIENDDAIKNHRKNIKIELLTSSEDCYFLKNENKIVIGLLKKNPIGIETSFYHEMCHANQHLSKTLTGKKQLLNKVFNYNYTEDGINYYCNPLEIEALLEEYSVLFKRYQDTNNQNIDKAIYLKNIQNNLNRILDITNNIIIKNILKTRLHITKISNKSDFESKTGITIQDAKRLLNSTFVNKYYIKLYIYIKSAKKQIKNILNQINKIDINKITENEILQKSKHFSEEISSTNEYLKQKQIELSTADKIDNTQAYGKIFVSGKDELVQKIEELQKDNPDIFIKVIDMDVIKSFDKSNDYTILYFKSKNGLDVEENASYKPEHIRSSDEQER